ncbi:sushi, von Willebrand factor type A, EGF and pentraxin domain-containing protein 1 [Sorex fumeus]|uniref:sushi, von Willebrand factor type A, EGF and pentraxin domain-containing protein 1 n=1 Tax=Sorex fumeus TaxID=62283 RepID=UPI0024ACC321|nr:sushi, von Willebrand factor type A, EGF and pentraxin domain-containing protein 1 [Sorex fumeus]
MWPRLALCCWALALVSGWATFPQLPPSRNFTFRFFPEAAAGAPGRLLAAAPEPGEDAAAAGSKVERLGQAFRRRVRRLRELSERLELVFLVDESSSVGQANFRSELRFVRKLLSDFPVVPSATRVAIVTFSSKNNVVPRVDYISARRAHQHKCALLGREIPGITYRGGGTYTKGAFQQAAQILRHSRENSTKVIFLITDGYSNGGDPRPIAAALREFGVEIFTIGIWQGNIRELNDMASTPKEEHCFLLHSFEEFEALARRALHEDLPLGSFIQEDISHCSYLCEAGRDCCDQMASCKCGTHTGQFECICEKGYYGKGLQYECTACPPGTFKPEGSPGGISTCLPCPDENHTSPPGSTSLEDCVCKEGYRASGQTCEVVHCPALRPPENGYFIQNICNNHFNAACGVRCHPGFDLVGSSILLCQPNGLWSSSESSCKVKTCPHLRQPKHGHFSCSTREMSYKTTCLATCDEGYRLDGTAKLTCQGNGQWDGLEPRCVERRCSTFQKPKGVILSPPNCGKQPARLGTVCQLSCRQGFILSGVREEVRCTTTGKWSARVQTAVCKDVEAPQIKCPKDIEAKTQEQQDSANVTWQIPTAKDNSGEKVSLHVHPAFTPPYLFPIGDVAITYTATDQSNNQASCTFHVRVIDAEPPAIDWCRSPPPIQVSEKLHAVTWDEPQFSDNSGAVLVITKSHSPGDLFPHGDTVVQYTATDPSGNNRTCDIHIVIKGSPCEVPFTPVNGDFVCTKDSIGVNCTLRCLEGYDFTEGSTEKYYCAYEDDIWKPPYSIEWPDCAIKRFANNGFKSFEMLYKATRCDDTDMLKKFSEAFETTLGKMVPSFCSEADDIDCRLETLTKKFCLEYNYDYENGFAIGPAGWGASNKVDYSYDDFLDAPETPTGEGKARASRMQRSTSVSDHKIKLVFNITASVPLPDERNDTVELENQRRLIKTLETITNRLKRTLNNEPMNSIQLASETLVADSNSIETGKAYLFCRPGSMLRGRMCVNCPLGTYYSVEYSVCESCYMGYYQDEEGQLECKACPPGTHTEYLHSRSISECKAWCKQGTYSSTGFETCESCPLNTYQPTTGSTTCLACPQNSSTVKRGAVDISACGVPCPVGEFSRSGLMPCYPCPHDYYQPDSGKSFCLSCPFYGTTTFTGATSITDCSSFSSTFSAAEESIVTYSSDHIKNKYEISNQVFHECFLNPCHNSGTCQQLGRGYSCLCPRGYTGLKCEIDINECSSLPCLNNGICKDQVGEFICECPSGYTGRVCEENINECSSSPCLNKGICIDGIGGYGCTCAKGYTGLHCETEVNECEPNPCFHNAICEDHVGGFLCKCPPGFLGTLCEKDLDECLSQPCKNGATCEDGANGFRCQCVPGFTGPRCGSNINECQSNPCRNQATCVDEINSYSCKCHPGFSGSRCEIEQSNNFNLIFEVSGIYGYVMLDGVLPSLHAVTCTFWMNSSDTINYGTPISYALENGSGSDNTFLLTDYNGWVLYVNGKEKITNCPSVNDGSWHHIAVTWTSVGGAWRVYIDGKFSDGGVGLSVGSPIPGGGALVIGQEQDKKGEGFNPAESFVGSISQLNLWDYVLSPQQVKSLATSCPEELSKGNVLAWPDFLSGVVGKVKIEPKSIFCSDCPPLEGSVPHLRTASADLKPGSKINLSCDPGFQLVGNPVRSCLNQGQWTQPLPHCERISCGVPPPLENGFYSAEDFHAGSTVTYQCNNGYYLLGDSRMFCTDNGSWNGISPSCLDVDECAVGSDCNEHASCLNTNGSYICSCIPPYTGDGKKCAEPVKCKAPGNPDNGKRDSSEEAYMVGASITFSCEEGYQLTGVSTVTCLESGEWNHLVPYCKAVSCGMPTIPENGGIDGSEFTYGSKVTYRCNKGHTLNGDKESSCLASGSWSHSPPKCVVVTCSNPESIENGKYLLNGLAYLSTASYSCDSGYSLQGPSVLECSATGSWDRAPPTCHLVFCGEPPAIKDAVLSGSNFTFGNKVTYICKEGYTLAGPDTIECLANGKWSGSSQQCLAVSCDEPPNVDHASPETAHRLFGDIAFYYCSDGYSLADNSRLFCNSQGKWVPPEGQTMPRCIAHFCENPPSVSYSILESVNKAKFAIGSVVSFKCMDGFILNTSAKIECMRGGEWNPSPMSIQCIPVRCGEPPSILNGHASGSNYSFGATVAYSCNKGFYIKGEKKLTCAATGQWSSPIPTCHPVSCNEPPKVENGFLEHTTGKIFESEARYRCNPGYKPVGSLMFVCQANRHWHSESPLSCVPLNCGKPPPFQNGYVKGENFEVGSKVQFFCNEGYELLGDHSWTCQKSGKWNKKPNQRCVPAKCAEPPLLENQLILKELTTEVGVVMFSCKEGHVLQGPSVLKCLPSLQWNDSFPVCKMVLCPQPPLISFGVPAPSSLHFGSTVKYTCVDGFFLKGETTTFCQADGTWSSPLPECVPVECPQPEEILNGIIDVQGLAYLSTALYTCKPGFELVGNTTILCGENGHWLGGKPICKPIECPKPKEILNGKFSYTNLYYGQTITYSCDRGFRLEGHKALTCLETGDWDMDVPSCSAIHCNPPQPIENGFVEGADYSYGAMIIYSCIPGFQVAGHAMQTCEESGWSSSIPICVPIDCGLPPHIDFGDCTKVKDGQGYFDQEEDMMEVPYLATRPSHHVGAVAKTWENSKGSSNIHATNFLYGTMVLYTCHPGYELLGNPLLICQEDGIWNGTAPSCISIECDMPTAPENGFLHFTETTMGSAVKYSCKPGHSLVGSDIRLCLQNKEWSNTSPSCEAISCEKPNSIMNGSIRGSNYTYQSVLYYECDPGYVLNGTKKRICQENKNWDGEEPFCLPVDCGSPPVSANGQVRGDEYTFQNKVEYTCTSGFLLEGATSRICLEDGSWSGTTPICVPIKCAVPPQIENGVMNGLDYSFGKEVVFQCHEGYMLYGASKLTCQSDGSWDAEPPLCKPLNCRPPEDLPQGFPNGFSFVHGGRIQYQCFSGYKLHGNPSRQCLSNGSWSGSSPSCLPCQCSTPVIQNGVVNGTDFACGKATQIRCFKGFKLVGLSEIICEASGQWSSGFPRCEHPTCGSPPVISNALISESGSLEEDGVTYNCRSGYIRHGPSDLFCTEKGSWSQPYPACEPLSCGPPPSVANAVATGEAHTYESKVKLRCLEGFRMDTDIDTFTCQKDGQWFPETISCSPIKCPLPTNITHLLVLGDDFSVNKQVSVLCAEGYTYEGANMSTCQLDGTWEPPFSDQSCIPVSCEKPESPEHGSVVGSKYSFESVISYQCKPGYELEGNRERICQGNGKWSGEVATCNKARCEVLLEFPNGKADVENTTSGPIVAYSCNRGYSLEGVPEAYCTENGTWSHPVPLCKPNPCPVPFVIPENALLSEKEFYVDQNVSIKCREGFLLRGQGIITCNPDETWTQTSAKCEKISCGPPAHIEHALARGIHYQYGDMITYSCYSGYMLEGSLRSVCLENGTWTTPPTCRAVCRFPCQNGGICQRPNACSCPEGWMGRLCEEPICILPCLNGGRCVAPYQCECTAGWTGTRCHTAVCQSPCLNGGKCVRPNRCHCLPAWTGHDCSRKRRTGV